jgi:hypothetical protein
MKVSNMLAELNYLGQIEVWEGCSAELKAAAKAAMANNG